MSARSLFRGQAPEFKIAGTVPSAIQDGYSMAWDEGAKAVGFSAQPVNGITTASSGAVVSITESGGGTGEFATIFKETYAQRLNAVGDQLITLTVQGGNGDTNLTGGNPGLTLVLPPDLTADGSETIVCGSAVVTDSSGEHLCLVYVSGSQLTIVYPANFAPGAWSMLSFIVTYIHYA